MRRSRSPMRRTPKPQNSPAARSSGISTSVSHAYDPARRSCTAWTCTYPTGHTLGDLWGPVRAGSPPWRALRSAFYDVAWPRFVSTGRIFAGGATRTACVRHVLVPQNRTFKMTPSADKSPTVSRDASEEDILECVGAWPSWEDLCPALPQRRLRRWRAWAKLYRRRETTHPLSPGCAEDPRF